MVNRWYGKIPYGKNRWYGKITIPPLPYGPKSQFFLPYGKLPYNRSYGANRWYGHHWWYGSTINILIWDSVNNYSTIVTYVFRSLFNNKDYTCTRKQFGKIVKCVRLVFIINIFLTWCNGMVRFAMLQWKRNIFGDENPNKNHVTIQIRKVTTGGMYGSWIVPKNAISPFVTIKKAHGWCGKYGDTVKLPYHRFRMIKRPYHRFTIW